MGTVQTVENLRISHLEIALAKIHHELVSSTGLNIGYDSTRALLNITFLGQGASGESDLVIRTTEDMVKRQTEHEDRRQRRVAK